MKNIQAAIDAVFSKTGAGSVGGGAFPRTVGTKDEDISNGGPGAEAKFHVAFETAADPAMDGGYEVKLTRRWLLNGKESHLTLTYKVQADGIVGEPLKSGDDFPVFD